MQFLRVQSNIFLLFGPSVWVRACVSDVWRMWPACVCVCVHSLYLKYQVLLMFFFSPSLPLSFSNFRNLFLMFAVWCACNLIISLFLKQYKVQITHKMWFPNLQTMKNNINARNKWMAGCSSAKLFQQNEKKKKSTTNCNQHTSPSSRHHRHQMKSEKWNDRARERQKKKIKLSFFGRHFVPREKYKIYWCDETHQQKH